MAFASVFAAVACTQPLAVLERPAGEVVLRFPNGYAFQVEATPDGALFAAGSDGLFRADGDSDHDWTKIAEPADFIVGLYAPTRQVVYAIGRRCGTIYRWDQSGGWRVVYTLPPPDATSVLPCDRFFDIWGRNDKDIYAVGTSATIAHFDGATWTLEPPPPDISKAAAPGIATTFWGISGTDSTTYTGNDYLLLRKTGGGAWIHVRTDSLQLPSRCGFFAIAAAKEETVFGWNNCLTVAEADGKLRVLAQQLPGIRSPLGFGRAQPDGTALLWTYAGDVAAVEESQVRVYQVSGISAVGRAAVLGKAMYLAGRSGADGVIVRVSR